MRVVGLCGLPRTGSTLYQNILNQNPRFHVSSTSCLPQTLAVATSFMVDEDPFKSDLANDADETRRRLSMAVRGFIEGWYSHVADEVEVVFDKSRAWPFNAGLLLRAFPDAALIACVRDVRDVLADAERQHMLTPEIDPADTPLGKTQLGRTQKLLADDGVVGLPMRGLDDLVRRRNKATHIVRYESFVQNPEMVLRNLYDALGEPWFDHDLDNVEDTATDLDALYLNKWPHHNSTGKVEARPGESWKNWLSIDVADLAMRQSQLYNAAFGYA